MQKNKLYRVLNTHDYKSENKIVHEYDISSNVRDDGIHITLYRSHDDCWDSSVRGEKVIEVLDTGDEMIYPKKMFSGVVDYAKHAELFILLSFLNKTEFMPLYQGEIHEVVEAQTIVI